ncbi:MAG: hypothetical protein OD918_07920 [Gammaproteobacteria bacterium]
MRNHHTAMTVAGAFASRAHPPARLPDLFKLGVLVKLVDPNDRAMRAIAATCILMQLPPSMMQTPQCAIAMQTLQCAITTPQ